MEFSLTKAHRLVVNSAAEGKSRPILQAVNIRKGIIESANGFVLTQKFIDYDGDESVLINSVDMGKIKDMKSTGNAMFNKSSADKIKVIGQDMIILQPMTGTFPNIDALYPKDEPVFQIILGRSVLLSVLKSLDKHEEGIKFTFYGEEKPVKFEVAGAAQGLIMPRKCR